MKTLVNKANPQIRITAPDGMVKNRTNCWAIWSEGNRLMLLDKDNWTLVVEEPDVDLEKAAEKYAEGPKANWHSVTALECAFKAGAEWQKEQLLDWAKQFTEPKIFVSTLIDKINSL